MLHSLNNANTQPRPRLVEFLSSDVHFLICRISLGRRACVTAFSLLFLAVLISATASAGTIYQTGFESPTYLLGGLNGQSGWTISTVPIIETSIVHSGLQAVQFDASGLGGPSIAFRPLSYNSLIDPNQLVVAQSQVELSTTGT